MRDGIGCFPASPALRHKELQNEFGVLENEVSRLTSVVGNEAKIFDDRGQVCISGKGRWNGDEELDVPSLDEGKVSFPLEVILVEHDTPTSHQDRAVEDSLI